VRRILRWLAGSASRTPFSTSIIFRETITAIVGDGSADGCAFAIRGRCRCSARRAGRARALPLLGASPFLIVNGDT
jgi:hypothetical protein